MRGIIRDGDIVEVKKKSFSKLEINDIAVIYLKKKLITHRVIYKTHSYLITKGDANMVADGRVYPHQIIGVVDQIKRGGKNIRLNDAYLIQSSYYFKEITKIVCEFTRRSISYVVLKGLPLHLSYEGEHPRRIYADCDILINKTQLIKIEKVLKGFGYESQTQSLSKIHDRLRKKIVEVPFYKIINGFSVVFDVHLEIDWMSPQLGRLEALYPQKLIDKLTGEFLKEKRKITIHGSNFYILPSFHLIIYLCLHFFHHNFQGVFRLDLINRVVEKMSFSPIQQEKIVSTIGTYQLENYIYPSLLLLQKYFPETKRKIKPIIGAMSPTVNYSGKARSCFAGQSLIVRFIPSIFNDEGRIEGGMRRFILIFLASPQPFWKKIFVFFQPSVLFSVWWVLQRRISHLVRPL